MAVGLALSCGPKNAEQPASADPEAMSLAEYDQARDSWLTRNNLREALSHALKSAELDEDNAEATHLVALLYLDFCRRSEQECHLDQAELFARRAVDLKEDFREARNTLGVILIHRRKYSAAIQVLLPLSQDILYSTPENAWGNLGWAYLESGRLDDAIGALRRSVAAQPKFCVGHYRLGVAHHRKGQNHQARAALTRALDPSDQRCQRLQAAFATRAAVALELGDTTAARRDAERCVELDDRTKDAHDCRSILAKLE